MRLRRTRQFIAICALTSLLSCHALAVDTSAASSILIERESGRVLFEQCADEERLIASITKIMTAVVALEHGDLNAVYTVTAGDMAEGSSMYLNAGDELTLEKLLYGLMLVSGNDAALAVAHCVSGEVSDFVDLMNDTAGALGMNHSSFANPSGLNADGHYSSARDMAVLTAYALGNETFRRIVSTESIAFGERYFKNHNKLLSLYDGCIGVKTGFTKAAGRTLVSAAERDGMNLICVTLSDNNDWSDHMALLDYGFQNYSLSLVVRAMQELGHIPVRYGDSGSVNIVAADDLLYPVAADEQLLLRLKVPVYVAAPVFSGQKLGQACLCLDGQEVAAVDLVASETILKEKERSERGFLSRLFN